MMISDKKQKPINFYSTKFINSLVYFFSEGGFHDSDIV